MTIELIDPIGDRLPKFLALEREASLPYANFVWGPAGQTEALQERLYHARSCEFAPPHGQLARIHGEPVGILCCLLGEELKKSRLTGAMVLSRSEAAQADPGLRSRLKLAGSAMWKPEPDDFYLSRIAVAGPHRGKGIARELLTILLDKARAAHASRCLLEVDPLNKPARAAYHRAGFVSETIAEVVDEQTGRRLAYEHFSLTL